VAAAAYGWHVAMMVAGAPGLALALVIGLTLREPRRGQQDDQPQTSAQPLDFRQSLAFIVRTPALVHMFIGGAFASSVVCVMGVWLPALLMRDFSASIGKVGPALAFSGGAMGVLGSLICGPIADRLGQGSPARMAFLTGTFVAAILSGSPTLCHRR
jgi:predicted MFS family arabinose efflux permease